MLRRRRSYLCLDRSIQAKRVYGDRHSSTRIRTLFPGKLRQFTRTRLESFVLLRTRTVAEPSSTPLSEPEALRSLAELRRHWTQGTRRTRRGDNAAVVSLIGKKTSIGEESGAKASSPARELPSSLPRDRRLARGRTRRGILFLFLVFPLLPY